MCALDVSPRPLVTLFPATCLRHFPLHLLASLLPQHLNTQNTPPPPSVCAAAAAFSLQQQCNSLCCSSHFSPPVDYSYPCFGLQLLPEYGPFWVPIYLHVGLYLLWILCACICFGAPLERCRAFYPCVYVCVCWEIMTSVVRNVGASFSSNSLLQLSMSHQFCCDRLCVQRSRACCLGTINPKLLRDMISGSASCVDFGGSSSLVGGWSSSSSSSSSSSCRGARRFGIQVRCSAPPPVAMPRTTSPHRPTSPKTRTQVSARATVWI